MRGNYEKVYESSLAEIRDNILFVKQYEGNMCWVDIYLRVGNPLVKCVNIVR